MMVMLDFAALILLLIGAVLLAAAGIGIVRMPDLFLRMSAATKASTLGSASLLLAAALHFGKTTVIAQALITIFFMFLTAPVGAHIIGRAAYRRQQFEFTERMGVDELEGYYDDDSAESPTPHQSQRN